MSTDELARSRAGADAFAERFLSATLGLVDVVSIHLGDRLGWYRALAQAGDRGMDPGELARTTRTVERYAREWLEQQAVAGILTVAGSDGASGRRFLLPEPVKTVLADPDSLVYMTPIARMFGAALAQLPALLEAYRIGGGVSWDQFGDDARDSQADVNRPLFEQQLAPALAGVGELHHRLSRPGSRIADVACGAGWSTIALARAYPEASLLGVDIDAPSIRRARQNAAAAGLADRIEFRLGDAAGIRDERLDVAFVFEALHDLPHPQDVLRALRSCLGDDGLVVVMDERVAADFAPDGDEVERLMYGYSLLVCLPDSMSTPNSVATGTVMRQATLERYAREAGFTAVEVLPIEDFGFFRFYLLRP